MRDGSFSFQKTFTEFSRIATDQVHEQNNKVIKGHVGATHLLNKEDESALIRWETCGPDIARIVSEFEDLIQEDDEVQLSNCERKKPRKHHEDTPTFQLNFIQDVRNLYDTIICNPFEMQNLTMRLIMVSINAKIHKNKLLLMNTDLKTKSSSANTLNTTILMNKLRSAAVYRPDQVSKLFEGEIFGVAQSLAEDKTSLYHGTKLEIKKRLPKCLPPVIHMQTSAIIIELSPVVFR